MTEQEQNNTAAEGQELTTRANGEGRAEVDVDRIRDIV